MKTFKHSGNTGDIIYSLYAMNGCGQPVTLYIQLDQAADYSGRIHPLGNVMMNQQMYNMLRPMILAFKFIDDVKVFNGETVDYDLDTFRRSPLILDRGNIIRWYFQMFPELTNDITKPLIKIKSNTGNYIVVQRTERYLNADVRYKSLNDITDEILFLGTQTEYELFIKRVPKAKHYVVTNFYEAMYLISGAKMFIGNQSMMFAIAEILKVPRAVELFKHCPNVIPAGGIAYDFINEQALKIILELNGIIK